MQKPMFTVLQEKIQGIFNTCHTKTPGLTDHKEIQQTTSLPLVFMMQSPHSIYQTFLSDDFYAKNNT